MRTLRQKSSLTISELQHQARTSLKQAGIETAALEARVLLCHVCKIGEAEVIAYPERPIDKSLTKTYFDLVSQRSRRIPLAHLVGSREFYGLEFYVNAQTLIPRPETEFAVDIAVECARDIHDKAGCAHILDLGVGTGCLLISILHEVEGVTGLGVDINPEAVELAKKNARNLGVEARATFHCMNWGEELQETFDIIVSNPPYIPSGDLAGLMPEVSGHEPVQALDGGVDGLDEYRKIIPQAHQLLKDKGVLILEIGYGQADDVLNLLDKHGFRLHGAVKRDLAGCQRIVTSVKVC